MAPAPYTPFGGSEGQCTDIAAAGIVVLPLCYEQAPSYGGGSGRGLYHILAASEQLERLDEETLVDWLDLKIHTLPPLTPSSNPEQALLEMQAAARTVLSSGTFLLSLGGDHAISLGPIMASADRYPGLGVLQIDAHLDLRDRWNGSPYNHACVMRRVVSDIGLTVVPVGTRSFSPEEAAYIKKRHIMPFYAHRLDDRPDDTWIEDVARSLPDTVYITIDLDGLDPSALPGTGTPEPGGLTYRQLIKLLKVIGKTKRVVAADISELAKIDGSQVSEATAAKIATKIMVYCSGTARLGEPD